MNNLTDLFRQETNEKAPEGCTERILSAIEKAAEARAKKWRLIWGTFSILSFTAFVASGIHATQTFGASNFNSYLSLIFSDTSQVATLWRELGLSLIESLPIIGIAIIIGSIAAVMVSMRKFLKYKDTGAFFIKTNARIA